MASAAFSSGHSELSPELQLAAQARRDAAVVDDEVWCDKPTVQCQCAVAPNTPCPRCMWGKAAPPDTCPGCWAEKQSRAATTLAALHRTDPKWLQKPTLHLAFVGVDQEECGTARDFLQKQLSGLLLYLLRKSAVQQVVIHAAGPCCVWPDSFSAFRCSVAGSESCPFKLCVVPIELHNAAVAECDAGRALHPGIPLTTVYPLPDERQVEAASAGEVRSRALTVHVASSKEGWEEYDSAWRKSCAESRKTTTALLVLPNAGLWGYDSWLPALSTILSPGSCEQAVVTTSYTLAEAEDDEEVLETVLEEEAHTVEVAWGPERSPTGSIHLADCKYKVVNNFAWQCIAVPAEA